MSKGNQGQGRQNGGSDRGARDPIQNVGEQIQNVGSKIQEGAAEMGHRIHENYDVAREEMGRRYRAAEGTMARNPTSSVLIGFGIGFGLGLVLTTLLNRPEETWADRYLPDRLRHAPDSLHHLADSLRNLPDAVARRMPSSMRIG